MAEEELHARNVAGFPIDLTSLRAPHRVRDIRGDDSKPMLPTAAIVVMISSTANSRGASEALGSVSAMNA
jgi:hypothetical protein